MADISAEIAAFQNAVYGEEVRSSMVSAIEKINDVAEDAESTVESFSSGVTQAISNANTAASAANTAASNANTKASAANTAATNANTARTAANNAATAANNAASAATTTNTNVTNAETARASAENARATAEATRQANEQSRQTAETARVNAESARASAESSRASAESQRQGNETTRQGNETVRQTQEGLRVSAESSRVNEFEDMQAAFADMQRQIVPQATTSTMGGVVVGDGLNVENALLSLATTKSGSGTAVASSGAVLESVVIYGQSVQDGTPTPDAPVDVQVVEGINLLENPATSQTVNGITFTVNPDGSVTATGTATAQATLFIKNFTFESGKTYIVSGCPAGGSSSTYRLGITGKGYDYGSGLAVAGDGSLHGINIIILANATVNSIVFKPQIELGSTATPYTPYGSIGLKIGDTVTPIDLNGNVLASLPDGTKDVLTVDSAGHCVLTKRTWSYTVLGTETASQTQYGDYCRAVLSNILSANKAVNYDGSSGYCTHAPYSPSASSQSNHVYTNQGAVVLFYEATTSSAVLSAYSGSEIYYELATPQTIDLGYIDMPTIPEDATISVSASMTPVIDASWWERGAEALANIVKAFSARLRALEEAVAELATA